MKIKDYRKWINSLPSQFDEYELTHREYSDTVGGLLNAIETEVYSVHIDEIAKKGCNMHKESYVNYIKFNEE